MKIDRAELIDLIKNKILRAYDKTMIDKIEDEVVSIGKFTRLEFKNLRVGLLSLDTLNDAEIYWIIEAASKYLSVIKPPHQYFDDVEIEYAKFYTRNTIEKLEFPIIFKDVEDLAPNENRQFGFYLTVKQISLLKSSGLLEVVPNLQRGGKKDKHGELKIEVNKRRSKEISGCIEDGNYFFDQIKINLINDEKSCFSYDPEERTLCIESGTLIIPDGNHRTIACEITDLENINANNKFSVAFTFLTPLQTKELLAQTWNMEPIRNRQKKSMKTTNSNLILDASLRNPDADPIYVKNVVRGSIGKNYQNGFILYDILSEAIDKYYETEKIETQDERMELAQWLVQFLNKLTSILVSDFKDAKNLCGKRWSVNPYTFVGYILISKYLKNDIDWKNKLKIIIDSIDFDNNNSPLENSVVKKKEKAMEIYFGEVIKNAKII